MVCACLSHIVGPAHVSCNVPHLFNFNGFARSKNMFTCEYKSTARSNEEDEEENVVSEQWRELLHIFFDQFHVYFIKIVAARSCVCSSRIYVWTAGLNTKLVGIRRLRRRLEQRSGSTVDIHFFSLHKFHDFMTSWLRAFYLLMCVRACVFSGCVSSSPYRMFPLPFEFRAEKCKYWIILLWFFAFGNEQR